MLSKCEQQSEENIAKDTLDKASPVLIKKSDDGVSAAIGVQHTEVANLGARWSRFLTVTLTMV